MRKVGMFLGFHPGDNLSIHGIGRLLAFLLKENDTQNNSIVLFCPAWLNESLYELLKDNKIPKGKFEVVTTDNIPYGVRLKNYWSERSKKKKGSSRIKQILRKYINKSRESLRSLVADLFSTSSLFLLLLKIIGYFLLAIIISPFVIVLSVMFLIYKLIRLSKRSVVNTSTRLLQRSSLIKIKSALKKARGVIYQLVLDNELNKLVNMVNKRKDVKVCFIPSMAWPQIKGLQCKKVLAAPDIVFYDFPTQFPGVKDIHKRIRKSISAADHLITYSEHVKSHHLMDKCGVDGRKITVIKHANIDMNQHLRIPKSIQKYMTVTQNAQQIVNKHIRLHYGPGHVLYNCNIEKLDCVVYSSQYRAHKNIFNLIKAIKIINRDMYNNVKLIITGDIMNVDYLRKYIHLNHLENDVIVMHNISSELLAAINKLSKCAVNPTLFEGGFPFTFSEAYSVGTPSVMSDIPVVSSEIEDPHVRELMLFDPYNPYSIAKKIIWAVENYQMLYSTQEKLYDKFSQRDWKQVADEYNKVFSKSIV